MLNHFRQSKVLFALITTVSLIAILIYFTLNTSSADIEKEYSITTVNVASDILIYEDIEEMAQNSEIVVVGYFDKFVEPINMLRNPSNILEESSTRYSEGHIYDFTVEEVVSGDLNQDTIQVGISFSNGYNFIDNQGKEQHIQIPAPTYQEPKLNQKYIVFLYKSEELNKYFEPFEPYRIEINKNNIATLDSALVDENEEHSISSKVFLEETLQEVHVNVEKHYDFHDKISGRELSELKHIIKKNFE